MRNRIPSAARVARRHASYSGNPDGKPIYDVDIDHGYRDAISGGSDVMQGLVNDLRREQGNPPMRLAGGDHPCQRGLPCECGGSCGCGGSQSDLGDPKGESYMSVQALRSMRDHAEDLLDQIDGRIELPDWVEAKLTGAAQSLNDVYEYMSHGHGRNIGNS